MFLRAHSRLKDGKEHRYWSIVENHRSAEGRVVQRQVLYLGEVNDSQKQSWCRTIEVLEEGRDAHDPGNPEAGDVRHQGGRTMVTLISDLHRDTVTFIPYGDTNFALSTFAGAASSTTDLPRKASRTVSTVWNGTRESAFT